VKGAELRGLRCEVEIVAEIAKAAVHRYEPRKRLAGVLPKTHSALPSGLDGQEISKSDRPSRNDIVG
jgi:phage baseplate assembly protein W